MRWKGGWLLMKANGVSLASRLGTGVTLKDLEADALFAKTLGECQATYAGTDDQDVQITVLLGHDDGFLGKYLVM